jgi:hypothetical protein
LTKIMLIISHKYSLWTLKVSLKITCGWNLGLSCLWLALHFSFLNNENNVQLFEMIYNKNVMEFKNKILNLSMLWKPIHQYASNKKSTCAIMATKWKPLQPPHLEAKVHDQTSNFEV